MTGRPEITGPELLERIAAGDEPAILDVRSRWEFDRGHVPGAIHLPFWKVLGSLASPAFRRDQPIVMYCLYGPRAWMAAAVLRTRGVGRIRLLTGHMAAWRRAHRSEEA